jgi:predicted esterase
LHGQGANHLEFPRVLEQLTGWQAGSSFIEVSVLGRGRGVGFVGLGEADVLHVLDYVEQHFHVDLDRVHLVGVSMGGNGVMQLAARHPQCFASVWSVCGTALNTPVLNLLSVPVYVTHSDDDWTAPALQMRWATEALPQHGGTATLDQATGYGHAIWKYLAGNERAREWTFARVRPRSRAVRRIDFTALDGNSARAEWAELDEWGPAPRPARFSLRVEGNELQVELQNVRRLRLHLPESPLDTHKPIGVVVHAGKKAASSAALRIEAGSAGESVVIAVAADSGAATLEPVSARGPFRLHTPGGPNQLYDGRPLLIVYGTRGPAPLQQAQKAAAELASHSANWVWFEPSARTGPTDGVPNNFNLYGALRVKADVEVTAEDLARHHLVLIGTAQQNSIVQRLADRLPVAFAAGNIVFSDGLTLPSRERTLRLVHYNPDAPERLLYWIASDDVRAYGPAGLLLESLAYTPSGADALVTADSAGTLVLARSFDSQWRWRKRELSPLLELAENSWAAADRVQAEAARRVTGAEFAIVSSFRSLGGTAAFSPGLTRVSDVTPYFAPLSVMKVTGRELLAASAAFSTPQQADEDYSTAVWPVPERNTIDPERSYSLVATPDGVYALPALAHLTPRELELTDWSVADALDAMLTGAPAPTSSRSR